MPRQGNALSADGHNQKKSAPSALISATIDKLRVPWWYAPFFVPILKTEPSTIHSRVRDQKACSDTRFGVE